MSGWKVLGLLVCLSLVGCSSKSTVEGTVTYKGKPLDVGTVTFYVGNQVATASLGEGGTYKALNVPRGAAKVTVQTPAAEGGKGGTSKMMSQGMSKMMSQAPPEERAKFEAESGGGGSEKAVPIPKQYGDPNSSGLTTDVKPGTNTFNIDLK